MSKKAANTQRILISVPSEVRQWLEQRAAYNASSLSGEAVRSIRQAMEREADRAPARTAEP